jgi:hypothetical protein
MHVPRNLMLGLAVAGVLALGTGCAATRANGHRHANESATARDAVSKSAGAYTYHYYPSAEVYYDPDREVYFWHASAYWGVGRRLPSTFTLQPAERVVLSMNTKMPYREHHMVIAKHPNPNPDSTYASAPTNER